MARALAVLLLLAVLPGCGPQHPVADPPAELVVAAGERSGVYYRYGQGLAEALAEALPDSAVSAVVTSGSVDNIERLARGDADVAFALADTAADAVSGTGAFPRPVALRALARLYTNSVHVVVPSGSPVQRVGDLAGLRVSTGGPGSGTEVTAARVLAAAGLAGPDDVRRQRLDLTASVTALRAGEIDAFFWVGGLPTRTVQELAATVPVRLLDLEPLLDTLRSRYPVYAPGTVPAGTYGIADPVVTLLVRNVLLVDAALPADLVEAMTGAVFAEQQRLAEGTRAARTVDARSAVLTQPVPLHEGALRWYSADAMG